MQETFMLPAISTDGFSPLSTQASHVIHATKFDRAATPRDAVRPVFTIEPLVAALLDELGHAVILVQAGAQVLHVNHAARVELHAGHSLSVVDGMLCACRASDVRSFGEALAAAGRGLRKLVTVGAAEERVALALIPIGGMATGGPGLAAVVFGRRRLCEPISVQCFARDHGLTPAESRVLELLCDGMDPCDIAQANDVGLSTVRTQVQSIRLKVGAPSIRRLLQLVAMLPPMVSSLRC